MKKDQLQSYSHLVWEQYKRSKIGVAALVILALFAFFGLYAPFFASSKPLILVYNGHVYFPLFRYLFYTGFYTKKIDLFYNLLMFTLPLFFVAGFAIRSLIWKKWTLWALCALQVALFAYFATGAVKDPQSDLALAEKKRAAKKELIAHTQDPLLAPLNGFQDWEFEKNYLPKYAKINRVLRYKLRRAQHLKLSPIAPLYEKEMGKPIPTLFAVDKRNAERQIEDLKRTLAQNKTLYKEALRSFPELKKRYLPYSHELTLAKKELEQAKQKGSKELLIQAEKNLKESLEKSREVRLPLEEGRRTLLRTLNAKSKLQFLQDRQKWMEQESKKISFSLFPLIRSFHWEDDAGGQQSINKYVAWWDLTRINRKDLVAGLIFGVRISLVVGVTAVALSLLIGIPAGMVSGYFAGKVDMFTFRVIEVWEAMPTFFMLLLVVAISQSKSIFLVIAVLGIFGWTGFARFMRAEVLKQRGLPYVLAAQNLGFRSSNIMFKEILPNAIPPILTLLPFSMMAAITSEAGLSFLGLGEEGSTSWGVLMDEGRSVFPGESYLLWPPAILLTILLISIALVGDALRDAIDPKLRQ